MKCNAKPVLLEFTSQMHVSVLDIDLVTGID